MSTEVQNIDLTKPIEVEGEYPTIPTVEFTEDEWTTTHLGRCINSTHDAYLVVGVNYGTFWIPKIYVRLYNS